MYPNRGQMRALPGNLKQPADWTEVHITCGRKAQEDGLPIAVRWYPAKKAVDIPEDT